MVFIDMFIVSGVFSMPNNSGNLICLPGVFKDHGDGLWCGAWFLLK